MALPIAGIISAIPWDTVIRNAPMVVERARSLWKLVVKEPAKPEPPIPPVDDQPIESLEQLQKRIIALEANNQALHTQMSGMSDLIVQLSEQNASLVERVEVNRTWLRRALILSVVAFLSVLYLIFRG
jgi:hypothetical protein